MRIRHSTYFVEPELLSTEEEAPLADTEKKWPEILEH